MLRIAIVLAIALRLSLILLLGDLGPPDAFRASDSVTYTTGAQSLASRGGFLDPNGNPEIFRTPGYPLVLAPFMALRASDSLIAALNIVFAVLVVIVTWRMARHLFDDDRVAGICALIVAVEPTMLIWSFKVMPETLFTLCLLLFAYAAINEKPIAAGIALSAAVYVKPIAWPLVLIVPLIAVWFKPKRALIFFVTCVALLAPWHIRNYVTSGYLGFSSLIDRSIQITAGGSVAARQEGVAFAEMRRRLIARDDARASDPQRYAQMRREGVSRIASDPLGWAKTHVFGMFRTLFEPGVTEYARTFGFYTANGGLAAMVDGGFAGFARAHPILVAVSIVWAIALLPLVLLPIVAVLRVPRVSRLAFGLFALITVYFVVAGGGVPGYHRFRVPAVPFLVLMSAFAYTARRCSSPSPPPARSPQPSES
ncbi:MAG: glycosyltransferase family 39 protein [Acidobacteria bacterium]|nr:glycosyltransferase family 39 protein [Acidobacteriota bacterium]MBV9070337.1 glycosyltransferase family 39 protein [Acidobacteriota bacterium]MBV9188661.1 glycosyltransferase family 39 protein [Acidobacteriota bacterium]